MAKSKTTGGIWVSWDAIIQQAQLMGGIPWVERKIAQNQEDLARHRADYKVSKSRMMKECADIAAEDLARNKQLLKILKAEAKRGSKGNG